MGLEKIRRRISATNSITIGGDAGIRRLGANVIGPLSGDTLGVDASTAVIGTAALLGISGAIVIRTQAGGSPCLAFRHPGGTVFSLFFATGGGAVTGTPVTS